MFKKFRNLVHFYASGVIFTESSKGRLSIRMAFNSFFDFIFDLRYLKYIYNYIHLDLKEWLSGKLLKKTFRNMARC